MDKTLLIAKREYLQRVKSKGFIIATLLGPLLLVALFVIPILVAQMTGDSGERELAVVDETGLLYDQLAAEAPASIRLQPANDQPIDSLRAAVLRGDLYGYLVLPATLVDGDGEPALYSQGGGGLTFQDDIRDIIRDAVREQRVRAAGAAPEVIDLMEQRVSLRSVKVTETGEEADGTFVLTAIGYVLGFMIYGMMFIYGAFVLRGVIEEKSNRIMEVIASSATPFQIMLGKVTGIGAMGLTQVLVWSGLSLAVTTFAAPVIAMFMDPEALGVGAQASQDEVLAAAGIAIPEIPASLFVYFILFFLGGYLLYAALFAAIGSAVENEQDAQSLQFPITLPIIIPILFITKIISDPDATSSVVMSLVPFFSPILMIVRIAATNVPFWQIGLSLVLLVLGFLATIWLAGRIYRVGILMYGKKPSLKDLVKWVRYA